MIQTQVDLTEEEHALLQKLAAQKGQAPGILVQQAVSELLHRLVRNGSAADSDDVRIPKTTASEADLKWQAALQAAYGLWADRDDLPDFDQLRREFGRFDDGLNRRR